LGIRLRDAEVERAHELLAAEEWLRLYLVDVLKIKPGHTERLIAGL
jgi:hypothetical protein